MKQKQWKPGGWRILLSFGQTFGIGFATVTPAKFNGADFYFGPVTLTVQPPIPARYLNQPS